MSSYDFDLYLLVPRHICTAQMMADKQQVRDLDGRQLARGPSRAKTLGCFRVIVASGSTAAGMACATLAFACSSTVTSRHLPQLDMISPSNGVRILPINSHRRLSRLLAPRYHAIELGLSPFRAFSSAVCLRSFARRLLVNLITNISMFTTVVLVVVRSPHPLLGP